MVGKDNGFKDFFEAYGRAYGYQVDRVRAKRVWERMSARDRRAAVNGISGYSAFCRERGYDMVLPSGYLKTQRWEVVPVGGTKTEHPQSAGPAPAVADPGACPHDCPHDCMETW